MDVLIVNDDPALLDALSGLLTMRFPDATVSTSVNPIEALQSLRNKKYDLLVADVKMPEMDGFAFVRAVSAIFPSVPIIMMTGHGETQLDQKAIEAGACTFIRKPLDRDSFVKTVLQLLQRQQQT